MARPVVVQKYGGTSVATEQGRAAVRARVAEARERGTGVVVVVSAMGRAGSPYATDTLLGLVAGLPGDERERDMLASCGELVSAVLVAHELRHAGIEARAFSGADAGILTDGVHGDASILAVDPTALREAVDAGIVPVVAGFQGASARGAVTTLGRGGSDTTACALGVALGAEAVEICTDVDGVMTADPRVCDEVEVLDQMRYEELFQMARHGAKVMHVEAAEAAMAGGVPVRIRSTFTPAEGTLVTTAERLSEERRARVATAVSHIAGIARVRVALASRKAGGAAHGAASATGPVPEADDDAHVHAQTAVFRALADAGVSLDMFTPMDHHLVFSVAERDLPAVEESLASLGYGYAIERGLAKVTLVGAGMHGVPGVMARMASALADAGVGIRQTADSHATISVLVPEQRTRDAVVALHRAFGLGG